MACEDVQVYDTWHSHVIWIDIRMSVMDGNTATRQIKSRLPIEGCDQPLSGRFRVVTYACEHTTMLTGIESLRDQYA